ncbi:amino acid ABC transporter substrate-binding protein (PAAT family) [Scopulibacillus darangshiensis]|uniref:Amino acid ABC transporter substrate-binding protein (PAAT family) n=1 Tax=Scopulibacillus darangshiensis TaxID=442528 RepID=A0A4R2NIN8_9BACL|nr:ABC transporter substrate-binding protein [Scopulibacillus darangshiensis]TCP21158.1 amino acid ABC transporter substrate-binding protein (PAAT family) [Scopulibacillus darangshiensis]
MKRVVVLLFAALLLLVGVTACGSKNTESGDKSEKSGLSQVKDSGVLRVGFEGTYPPFNFLNDKKKYDGFDVDISNEIARRLGVKTKFVATKWDGLIGGLKANKFDIIIAQMTITDERKKSVDFTDPYVVTGSVLVTRKDTSGLTKLEDIKGKKVGVGAGTTFEKVARSVDGADVHTYKTVNDYIQDLMNGRLDVIINDKLLMSYNIQKKHLPIKISSDVVNKDTIGMAVKKGHPKFVKALNKALSDMKRDGTYNKIYKKWFGTEPLSK